MKLWDIIKKVGSGVVREVIPGGNVVVSAINELLPDNGKIPPDASGDDLQAAFTRLPPSQQMEIMSKEFDVEIEQIRESNSTVRAMLASDAASPHTTRPLIARGSFFVVAMVILTVISMWAYGVVTGDVAMVTAIMGSWQFIVAAIGPLVTLLWSYFGVLRTEHKQKMDAANGFRLQSGISGALSGILKR